MTGTAQDEADDLGDVLHAVLEVVEEDLGEGVDPVDAAGEQCDAVAGCSQGGAVASPMPEEAPVTTATRAWLWGVVVMILRSGLGAGVVAVRLRLRGSACRSSRG